MQIGDKYIRNMIRAVRRNETQDTVEEVADLIREARADLIGAGVAEEKAVDETDPLIKGAVRCYVRAKFGLGSEDAEPNRQAYAELKDNLRRNVDYMGG